MPDDKAQALVIGPTGRRGGATALLRKLSSLVVVALVAGVLQATPAFGADPVGIDSATPQVTSAGAALVVTGHGFSATAGENTVRLNGLAAPVIAASTTRLDVTVPAGATSGPVTVASPDGSAVSTMDVFVAPAPFAAADVESTGRLAPGVAATAAVATATRVSLLSVAGQAGHRLSLLLTSSTFGAATTAARYAVYRPDGTALVSPTGFGSSGVLAGPLPLPVDGTYTVLIDPQGTAVGQVVVTAYDVPADAEVTASPGGAAVTAATTAPGQNAVVSFAGTAGQRVFFSFSAGSFGSAGGSRSSVRKPDGTALIAAANCGVSCTFDATVLPVAGTYTILIDPQSTAIGSLTVRIHDVPADAAATAIAGGPAVPVATGTPGQNGVVSFSGAAAQRVSFAFTAGTFGSSGAATVAVRKPDGTALVSATSCGVSCVIDTKTLPVAGVYTIFLDPQNAATGALTVRLHDVPADPLIATTLGAAAVNVTTAPGQNARITFPATAGDRISVELAGSTYGSSTASVNGWVLKPDGTSLVTGTGFGSSGVLLGPAAVTVTGTYTILIDPQGVLAGGVSVRAFGIADVTIPTTVDAPATTVSTETPGQRARVTFAGTAGQRVALSFSGSTYGSSTASLTAWLLKPDGTTAVAATGVGSSTVFFDALILPADGTYTALLDPSGALTGSVTVRVIGVPADTSATAATDGSAVAVGTNVPGQNMVVSFDGTAGQRASIRLTNGVVNQYATVRNPDGTVLLARFYSGTASFVEPLSLPATGIYTILIDPTGAALGAATVQVWVMAAEPTATAVPGGAAVTVTTTAPGQNGTVTVAGVAGQRVSFRFASTTSLYARIRKPDGTDLKARWYIYSEDFVDTLTLPVDGVYTILLDPYDVAVGTMTVQVYAVPADVAVSAQLDGPAVDVVNTTPGQNMVVSFDGVAGHRLSVKLSGSIYGDVTIRRPDGTDLKPSWYVGSWSFVDPVTLPVDGTYTVYINPDDAAISASTAQLYDVPADPTAAAVLDGTPVWLSTTTPGQNASVTFTGGPGHRVFAVLNTNGYASSSVVLTLRDPAGTSIGTVTAYGSGTRALLGPIDLTADGTYTLAANPNTWAVGVLTVALHDATPPPAVAATPGGSAVGVTVRTPGQFAPVTFSGAAGQRVSIRTSDVDFRTDAVAESHTIALVAPNGTTLKTSDSSTGPTFLGTTTLTAAGTYTVRVDPSGTSVGAAKVQVFDVPADLIADTTVGGGLVPFDLSVPGMTAVLRVPATAGQSITLSLSGGPGPLSAAFVDPAGTTRCTAPVSVAHKTSCTVGVAGTYEIRLSTTHLTGEFAVELLDGLGTPTITVSPPASASGWSTTHRITANWTATSTVPISGWAVVVDDAPGTVPGSTATQAVGQIAVDLADGVHYLHVRAIAASGFAGPTAHRPLRVDTIGSAVTAVSVPTHPDPAIATTGLTVEASFTAGPDLSGIAGYAVSVTHGADDIPRGPATPAATYRTTLPAEGSWYLHVVAVDGAGNRGAPYHRGILADTPPSVPVISSLTHPEPGKAYPGRAFVATWTARPAQARAWAVVLDHADDTVPGTDTDTEEAARHTATLTPGTWYLHVRGVDRAGNWGATGHFRIVVATTPAVAVSQPLAGRTVWGSVPVTLACPADSGPLTVQARIAGGSWRDVGAAAPDPAGFCTTTWATAGAPTAWPDGGYTLRVLDSTEVVADGSPVTLDNAAGVLARLTADYEAGALSVADYVRYVLDAAVSVADVPARYTDGADPAAVDHGAAMAIVNSLLGALPESVRSELSAELTPTIVEAPASRALAGSDCGWTVKLKNLTFNCVATTAHFRVFYYESRVGPTSPGGTRADFVQNMMDGAEEAWHVYRDEMHFQIPDQLDIILDPKLHLGAGIALPPTLLGRTQIRMSDHDPDMTRYLLRHEIFHFAQYMYMNDSLFANSLMNWWMEATAEWAAHQVESRTTGSANGAGGYYEHLDEFLEYSDERFDEGDTVFNPGGPEYGAFIVAEYLENRVGPVAILETWKRLGGFAPPLPGDVILELLEEWQVNADIADELERFRQYAYVLDANGTQFGFQDKHAVTQWRDSIDLPGHKAPHDTVMIDDGGAEQTAEGDFLIQQSGAKYVEINNPQSFAVTLSAGFDARDDDVRASVLKLDAAGKVTATCGGPARVPAGRPLSVVLDGTCPNALLTFVNAERPNRWGTWADGHYTIGYELNSVVLSNGVVDLGIAPYGNIYSVDGTGLRLHGRPETESVQQGCLCEGWGIGVPGGAGGSVTQWIGPKGLTLENFAKLGNVASSTVLGPDGLRVFHSVSPSGDSHLFKVLVSVTNTGTRALSPVRYRRVVDWDPNALVYAFKSYNTFQKLNDNTGYITGITNNGFADPDPSKPLTDLGAKGWFTDFGPDDTGAQIEIDLGTMAPGQTQIFTLYYGTAPDEATAIAAATAVGAQAYSLGQVPTDDGKNLGTPFTAVLAVDGRAVGTPPRTAVSGFIGPVRQFGPSLPGIRPVQGG